MGMRTRILEKARGLKHLYSQEKVGLGKEFVFLAKENQQGNVFISGLGQRYEKQKQTNKSFLRIYNSKSILMEVKCLFYLHGLGNPR